MTALHMGAARIAVLERHQDPRFLAPRWPLAADIVQYIRLAGCPDHFMARPVKTREQGPTVHWRTRLRKKAMEAKRGHV